LLLITHHSTKERKSFTTHSPANSVNSGRLGETQSAHTMTDRTGHDRHIKKI